MIRFSQMENPRRARYVQVGVVQGGVGACGSRDFPSVYVRLEHPEVLRFVKEHSDQNGN